MTCGAKIRTAWSVQGGRLAWLRGYTAALAALAPFGQDTIYDAVVEEGELDMMLCQARRDGALRWSGLSGYIRRQRERKPIDKATDLAIEMHRPALQELGQR